MADPILPRLNESPVRSGSSKFTCRAAGHDGARCRIGQCGRRTWTGVGTEWTNGGNWSSNPTVPDGTATFTNNGAPAGVNVNGLATTIGAISFTNTAPAYTININNVFTVNGAGVTNASAATQTFAVFSSLAFQNASSASAGAGPVTVTTNNGASTTFTGTSTGGTARFITNAGGTFNMSGLTSAGMTAGSIEGAGSHVLGSKTLTTGGNNSSTTVSGLISGVGGGLTKVGSGTMVLTANNTYTGPTTISAGRLALSGNGNIFASSSVTVDGTFDIATAARSCRAPCGCTD